MSVSTRAPIYLHLADGHVGFAPELSCWELLHLSVSQLVLEGRYTREDKGNQRWSEWKGSSPMTLWS